MIDTSQINDIIQKALDGEVNSGSVGEKLNQLMPSIWIMIATLGAFFILIIILTKFLYKPVKNMIKERQKFIQKNIDDSIKAKTNAIELEQQAQDKLKESKLTAFEIINRSKLDAEIIKNQYIDQGKIEAKKLISDANQEIKTKKIALEKETHNEIVDVAIQISQKLIAQKISKEEAQKYLNKYLGEKNDHKTK